VNFHFWIYIYTVYRGADFKRENSRHHLKTDYSPYF